MGYLEKKAEADYHFRRMLNNQRDRRFPFDMSAALIALRGEFEAASKAGLIDARNDPELVRNQGLLDLARRKRNAIVHDGEWGLRLGHSVTTRLPGPRWPAGQRRTFFMWMAGDRPISTWRNLVTGEVRVDVPRFDPLWTFGEAPNADVVRMLGRYRQLIRKAVRRGRG